MKIVIFWIILTILLISGAGCEKEEKYLLSDYPEPFVVDGIFSEQLIVIGIYGTSSDISAQTKILFDLQKNSQSVAYPEGKSIAVLHNEVEEPKAQYIILIGLPSNNPLITDVFGLTDSDFPENVGVIKIVENGDKAALLIGGDELSVKNGANALISGRLKDIHKSEVKIKSDSLGVYNIE